MCWNVNVETCLAKAELGNNTQTWQYYKLSIFSSQYKSQNVIMSFKKIFSTRKKLCFSNAMNVNALKPIYYELICLLIPAKGMHKLTLLWVLSKIFNQKKNCSSAVNAVVGKHTASYHRNMRLRLVGEELYQYLYGKWILLKLFW